nr:MAG TPA: hypothetical protein [Caudoviricetes sp.]DAI34201.1 MAG TPA: hypothetical protein [Caudoviricetes sp.]
MRPTEQTYDCFNICFTYPVFILKSWNLYLVEVNAVFVHEVAESDNIFTGCCDLEGTS